MAILSPDNQALELEIDRLRRELAELSSPVVSQPVIQPIAQTFTLEQVQEMIEASVEKAVSRVKELSSAPIAVEPEPIQSKVTTVDVINSIFTKEEQNWFCSASVLSSIDDFLVDYMNDDRKTALHDLFIEYREYYESKNKTHT